MKKKSRLFSKILFFYGAVLSSFMVHSIKHAPTKPLEEDINFDDQEHDVIVYCQPLVEKEEIYPFYVRHVGELVFVKLFIAWLAVSDYLSDSYKQYKKYFYNHE